jgi:IS5 family transposase
MYRKPSPQMTIDDFILPFAGKPAADNRWTKLAAIIPWDEIEKQYAFMFPSDRGNVAKPVRMALGALIIQARCGFTDRETVQQITENPYLQYFIGLKEYQLTRPFTPAAMVKFRKRFNAKRLADINETIIQAEKSQQEQEKEPDDEHNDSGSGGSGNLEEKSEMSEEEAIAEADAIPNQGTLILDATCTPADISFPTDHRLLNEAREQLDSI